MKQLSFRHLLGFAVFCFAICATAESAVETQGVGVPPELISPREGEVVDNGCQSRKNGILSAFEWREVPGAQRYHLYVKHPGAQNPVIDDARILTTGYCNWQQGSYVADSNRIGWTWRVRARVNREWTEWSAEHHFDVEAVDTDCAQHLGTHSDGQPRPSVPLQVAPPNESVFDHFPRTTTLEWTEVVGAASYVVEIDCFSCCQKMHGVPTLADPQRWYAALQTPGTASSSSARSRAVGECGQSISTGGRVPGPIGGDSDTPGRRTETVSPITAEMHR